MVTLQAPKVIIEGNGDRCNRLENVNYTSREENENNYNTSQEKKNEYNFNQEEEKNNQNINQKEISIDWHVPETLYNIDSINISKQINKINETTLPSYLENDSSTQSIIKNENEDFQIVQLADDDELDEIDDNVEDDNDDDEYEYDEDNEMEEEEDEIIQEMSGCVTERPREEIQHQTSNGQVLPSLDKTTFGEVHITSSQNVRVGNTTLYKGPVTIKQFVYSNSHPICENGEIIHPNAGVISNDVPVANGDSNTAPILSNYRENVKNWLWTSRFTAIMCLLALILITIIVVVSVTPRKDSEHLSILGPAIDPDDILTENVRFVKRTEWGAQPPNEPAEPLGILPAPYVIISHTASEGCNTQAECVQRVRLAQTMHIEGNGWDDIAYNFLVGGDGLVYVGRGWGVIGAHTYGYNNKSVGISFVGTFNKVVPPRRQIHAMEKLIEIGIKREMIAKDYKLLGHRQLSETLSPGDVLYSIIMKHDHWSEKP